MVSRRLAPRGLPHEGTAITRTPHMTPCRQRLRYRAVARLYGRIRALVRRPLPGEWGFARRRP